MNRLVVGLICGLWCLGVICAEAAGDGPFSKKADPVQPIGIPWENLDERAAALAKQLMEKPTVLARGPVDTFACSPDQYYWLLDNPDRAVAAWRRLGAKCVSIQKRGPGRFGYTDESGSDVTWEIIHQGRGVRIWFAEGKVKASAVLPLVPVKAMVILRHAEGKSAEGSVVMKHHTELIIHTDSKAAAAVTKLMGQSASKLAEQGLGQLQIFFSALSCYLDRYPERAEALFKLDK
ncbi:MAG: hypothetical protein EXR98_00990 [Gemmataceae bacterium]|nr:hypothetical protein [Gemmataceae bacterium]